MNLDCQCPRASVNQGSLLEMKKNLRSKLKKLKWKEIEAELGF